MNRPLSLCLIALAALCSGPVLAERKTVCTITVNSADEKDAMRARLPKGDYEFVELVEKGRPDWLRSSCQKNVQCDVLVVSGHFNAGDTFYSDRLEKNEYLEVDELERASCGGSCTNMFAKLKEVYLFGCESLNPDASKYASSHGESGRDRMRRLFPNVPSIYGFSGAAPVGPTAAMLLNKYFDGGGGRGFGTGQPSAAMLRAFSRNSMVRVAGVREGEPLAASRRQICGFFDERKSPAQKVEFVHQLLAGEGGAQRHFSRVEKLFASLTDGERSSSGFAHGLAKISSDEDARSRYLAALRRTGQAETRARMIALGATLGWLGENDRRREMSAMLKDLLAARALGFAEVDLVCTLNKDRSLDAQLAGLPIDPARATAPQAAVLACLGSEGAHAGILRALASRDERDVRVAQAYLRHRPIAEKGELRRVVNDVARMQGPAQVRALDTLARLNISDRDILQDLSRAFVEATSAEVQLAIAEVFIRSDPKALPGPGLAAMLRQHRLKPSVGRHDLIDTLLARLQPG